MIYDLCKQNLCLFKLGLYTLEEVAVLCPCIRQGKENIIQKRTPNPNWDQHNLWGIQDVCTCQGNRTESQEIRRRFVNLTFSAWDKNWKLQNFGQQEIRDVSATSASTYNSLSLLAFGHQKNGGIVATKHLEQEMMDCPKATCCQLVG